MTLPHLNIVLLMGKVMAMLTMPLLQPAMYSRHSSLVLAHSRVLLVPAASFTIILTWSGVARR